MRVMDLHRLFTEHPESVGETYGEHMVRASCFGGRMVVAGLACMMHALLPFIFVRTGSQAIEELNARMLATRRRTAASQTPASQAPVIAGERLRL
jgi:Family of unknown function (DUF6356)